MRCACSAKRPRPIAIGPTTRSSFALTDSPTAAEIDEIMSLYQSQRQRLADGWISSRAIATGDHEKLPDLPKGVSPTDAAAWTVVARVLLNLDETFTKG